jgi:hypothetical protein
MLVKEAGLLERAAHRQKAVGVRHLPKERLQRRSRLRLSNQSRQKLRRRRRMHCIAVLWQVREVI